MTTRRSLLKAAMATPALALPASTEAVPLWRTNRARYGSVGGSYTYIRMKEDWAKAEYSSMRKGWLWGFHKYSYHEEMQAYERECLGIGGIDWRSEE